MCLRESLEFPKGSPVTVLYDVYRGIVTGPMQRKLASSEFDLGYSELFCIPEVTSVFVSSCESILEDSLEINQANRGSLRVCLGKCNCSACNSGESGLISRHGGSLMFFSCCGINPGYILELWRGCPFETRVCSAKSGHISRYDGQLRNLN